MSTNSYFYWSNILLGYLYFYSSKIEIILLTGVIFVLGQHTVVMIHSLMISVSEWIVWVYEYKSMTLS